MLVVVIGAVFCCVPLAVFLEAVFLEQFIPARRPSQQPAANDNFCSPERLPAVGLFSPTTSF
jgi:hypothetical protein